MMFTQVYLSPLFCTGASGPPPERMFADTALHSTGNVGTAFRRRTWGQRNTGTVFGYTNGVKPALHFDSDPEQLPAPAMTML
jgi:hypothetical protein